MSRVGRCLSVCFASFVVPIVIIHLLLGFCYVLQCRSNAMYDIFNPAKWRLPRPLDQLRLRVTVYFQSLVAAPGHVQSTMTIFSTWPCLEHIKYNVECTTWFSRNAVPRIVLLHCRLCIMADGIQRRECETYSH